MPVLPARTPSLPWSDSLLKPGNDALDDERGDPAMALRAVDVGEGQDVIGSVAQADPDLGPVEDVPIAVAPGGGDQVGGVAAHARLGEPERRELLASRLRRKVALLLLLGSPLEQRQRVQAGMHREDDAERGVGALHLLAQQREGDVVHAGPAVSLGDRQAQQALGAHLLVERAVVGRRLVELADARQDLALGEGARSALHLALRIGQREVDHRLSVGVTGRAADSRPMRPSGDRCRRSVSLQLICC